MPVAVSCPQCRKTITLDAHDAGGRVMCLACGSSFTTACGRPGVDPAEEASPSIAAVKAPPISDAQFDPGRGRDRRVRIALTSAVALASCALVILAVHITRSRPMQLQPETATIAGHDHAPSPPSASVQPHPSDHTSYRPETREESDLPAPGKSFVLNNVMPTSATAPAVRSVSPETRPVALAATTPSEATLPALSGKRQAADDPPAPGTMSTSDSEIKATSGSNVAATAPLRPPLRPAPPSEQELLDKKVEDSIELAQRAVLRSFSSATYKLFLIQKRDDRSPSLNNPHPDNGYPAGLDALAVYALMQSGLATHDPRLTPNAPMMSRLIDEMKRLPATTGRAVYARGIRAAALALFNRREDRPALQDDVSYLLRFVNQGGYSYPVPTYPDYFDNSNSQYGLLGVWSGAEVGIEVPETYWAQVEHHWVSTQLDGGRWGYQHSEPRVTMTAAGIASLFITHEWLDIAKFNGDVGRDPFSPTLRQALDWWEIGANYQVGNLPSVPGRFGYAVYGIERVGLACGFKFFGSHEWYREMAGALLPMQRKDGTWIVSAPHKAGENEMTTSDLIDTSYILIFLARARHPVLMNKLRTDHVEGINNRYWDNRPHDMHQLANWSSHELERPLNWQIVNLERDWTDWMDSPVLYIASHRPLKFSEADLAKLRHYVEAGGMIFTQADGDSSDFSDFVRDLAKKLFPKYELQAVPPSHPLYSVDYDLGGNPPLKMVTNGSRILLLHSPKDVARYWETRDDKLHKRLFQLGLNISLYAGGKGDLRIKRLADYPPEPPGLAKDAQRIKLLRLMYNGNWDPEPGSWERYRRVFQNSTGSGLELDTIQLKDLRPGLAPIAHLTGAAAYELTADEAAALRSFVQAGGVVLIDACGGSGAFADSMRKSIAAAFAGRPLERVPSNHPLLSLGNAGMADLSKAAYRPYVLDKVGGRFGGGIEMLSAGRGHVIFSSLDLSTGMLGTHTWGVWGFTPEYCQSLLQNLIFWTVDGQADPLARQTPPTSTVNGSASPAQTRPGIAATAPAVETAQGTTQPAEPVQTASAGPATAPTSRPSVAGTPNVPSTAPSRPPLRPAPASEDEILDAKIEQAIMLAQDAILGRFSDRTNKLYQLDVDPMQYKIFHQPGTPENDNGYHCGLESLAIYALMQAGLTTHDPRLAPNAPLMSKLIATMKSMPATNGHAVYARGIRATALALFNRREDRAALQDDVSYLLRVVHDGAYSYPVPRYALPYDNSNSQYGLLGVWSGAEVGIEVPQSYWDQVQRHWILTQVSDGRWAYQHDEPTITMTDAGIASLFITREWLAIPTFRGDVGRDPFSNELRKAMEWYETGTNYQRAATNKLGVPGFFGYAIYGIERVGLASGFKFFGSNDWYHDMAKSLVALQRKDGKWRLTISIDPKYLPLPDQSLSDLIDTSYLLIFLARERHPVLMNKLRTDHTEGLNNRYWDNRPNDMHNLASWSSHELERPLNWQIVNLERDWTDWMDSPVLYIASHRPLKFSEADLAKLRHYVEAGGMIFTQADGDSSDFNDFVKTLSKKLFPNYELQNVPPSHPVYSVNYDLGGNPPLKMVTNGSRILLLHSPKDLSRYWETRDDKLHKRLFQLGLNISLYAGGKGDLRIKRLANYPPEPPPLARDVQRIKVLRLMYNGNWDPEPGSWERYRRVFERATGTALDVDTLQIKDLRPGLAAIAHVTGTAAFQFTPDEATAMRNFVESGGVVLIDACGGSGEFADAMRKSVSAAFGGKPLAHVAPSHPILSAGNPGMADLSKPQFRPYVLDKVGGRLAGGFEMLSAGRGHVIFSPLDLSTGMLGTNTWGVSGFTPEYCQSFVQNLIFWTVDGQADAPPQP